MLNDDCSVFSHHFQTQVLTYILYRILRESLCFIMHLKSYQCVKPHYHRHGLRWGEMGICAMAAKIQIPTYWGNYARDYACIIPSPRGTISACKLFTKITYVQKQIPTTWEKVSGRFPHLPPTAAVYMVVGLYIDRCIIINVHVHGLENDWVCTCMGSRYSFQTKCKFKFHTVTAVECSVISYVTTLL